MGLYRDIVETVLRINYTLSPLEILFSGRWLAKNPDYAYFYETGRGVREDKKKAEFRDQTALRSKPAPRHPRQDSPLFLPNRFFRGCVLIVAVLALSVYSLFPRPTT